MSLLSDILRTAVAAIVILLSGANMVHADFDGSVGASLRSYPLSGVVEADAGYGILLWGAQAPGSPWYGYLRPVLEGASSVSYNSGLAALEFFPLSILGVRAGGESIENDKVYSAYDCVAYQCLGRDL